MSSVRTAVIGTGVMGEQHARWLAGSVAGSELTAVYDIDASRARSAGAQCRARVFDDAHVLIKDDDVDAVVVASSDATHEQFVLACLAAGKPVLCEKPLAPDVAGCRKILAAEAAAGARLVTVGFMRRFDPGYRELRQALRDGSIGVPLVLHCTHRTTSSAPAPSPAALITSSAVHEFDIVRWLLGEDIAKVTVHVPGSAAPGEDPDLVVLVATTTSGVVVTAEVFWVPDYGYEVSCEVVGGHGTALLEEPSQVVLRRDRLASRRLPSNWIPRFAAAYRSELQDWVDAVAAGRPPLGATARDGYAAALACEAAIAALETGCPQPVQMPEEPASCR